MKSTFIKFTALLLICVMMAAFCACSPSAPQSSGQASEDKIVMDVAVGAFTAESPRGQLYAMLEEKLEEAFEGRFEWNMLTPGSIGGDKDMMNACSMGTVDFVNLGDVNVDIITGSLGWAFLPMMYSSYEDVDERYFKGWVADAITAEFEKLGMVRVGHFEAGFRMIANTERPIVTMEDFKGLKIRCAEISYINDFYKFCGALPVAMANTEVITALETGTISGQDNYLTAMANMGALEMTKYITTLNYLYCGNSLCVSQSFWDSMSAADQELFTKVVKECSEAMIPVAREEEKTIIDQGVADGTLFVNEPDAALKEELKKVAMQVWEQESEKYDPELMQRVFDEFGIKN